MARLRNKVNLSIRRTLNEQPMSLQPAEAVCHSTLQGDSFQSSPITFWGSDTMGNSGPGQHSPAYKE